MYNDRRYDVAEFRITNLSKAKCVKIMEAIKDCEVCVDIHIAHSNYATITIAAFGDKLYDFKKAVEKANELYHEESLWGKKSENDF